MADCTYTIKLSDQASEQIERLCTLLEAASAAGQVIILPRGAKVELLTLDGPDCAAIGIDPPDETA
jgi:hypothetical protein